MSLSLLLTLAVLQFVHAFIIHMLICGVHGYFKIAFFLKNRETMPLWSLEGTIEIGHIHQSFEQLFFFFFFASAGFSIKLQVKDFNCF